MASNQEVPSAWKVVKPYVNGGLSGMMSTVIIQPIDMVKVRLQLGETGGPVRGERTPVFFPSVCLTLFWSPGCSLESLVR